jgi:hypothetical protein
VTILIRLMLYSSYIAPLSLTLNTLPAPLKAIAGGFLVLVHTGLQSPSTIYHYFNLFHSPSPPIRIPHVHTHTVPLLRFCLSLFIFKLMVKRFLNVSLLWVYFALVHSTPSIILSYPFNFQPPFSTPFNMHPSLPSVIFPSFFPTSLSSSSLFLSSFPPSFLLSFIFLFFT